MAGIGSLDFLDNDDDCQVMATDANNVNKDWCKHLHASMARLDQMHPTPSVCNMFLQPAGSLKPPKSMTKPLRERKQHSNAKQRNVGTKFSSSVVREEDGCNDVNQDSFRSLSQSVAWGSNSSIPDLLARQKSQTTERPSSASRFPPRNRPNSASKTRRPQSAKDTNCEKQEIVKDLGTMDCSLAVKAGTASAFRRTNYVKGSKKQMDSRMAGLNRSNSDTGIALKSKPETTSYSYSAMINSTIPKFNENFDNCEQAVENHDKEVDELDTKTDQPESTETMENISEEAYNPSVRASQEEDKPVTPPMPESIRFSLPNMNDDVDEDDGDELNTDRLLQQAESFVQKKSDQEQQVLDSLAEAHATIPSAEIFSVHQALPDDNFVNSRLNDLDCPISSVAAYNSRHNFPNDKSSLRNNHSDKTNSITSNTNHGHPPLSPHVTWSDSHSVHLFQADSSAILHDGKMQATKNKTILNKAIRPGGKTGTEVTKTETFRNHKQIYSPENSFLMPDESHVSYKPLEVTKSDRERKNSLKGDKFSKFLKISEDVRSHAPDEGDKKHSKLTSCLSKKSIFDGEENVATGQNTTHKLVPTVTLAYNDENDEEQQPNDNKNQGKKKPRAKKTFDEIETYMSRLDKAEFEKTKENLSSDFPTKCGCGEISCEELLAQENQSGFLQRPKSASKLSSSLISGEKTPVVKTTKTIEFCEGNSPAETVIKNTLVAAHETKPEKPEPRQRLDTTSILKPSMIKRQQATEDKPNLKSVHAKKTVTATEKFTSNMSPDQPVSSVDSKSRLGSSEGGLAPLQTPDEFHNKTEVENDPGLYETLLEEAKSMALTSMMEAAKTPTKVKTAVKTRPKISSSAAPEGKISTVSKPRPFSAPLKIADSKASSEKATKVSSIVANNKHKYCQHHTGRAGHYSGIRRPQSAKSSGVMLRLDSHSNQVDESPEMCHAQRMQMKMAAMGVHVEASVLEKALFPPSGKSIHYNVPGDLPRNPTESLIPHYKHWLAEDYHRVKLMERRLAQDDEIKYMQKVAAEKRALLQKKGKKKKKKEKCVTSAG